VPRPGSALLWRSGILTLLVAGGLGAGFVMHGAGGGSSKAAVLPHAIARPVVCGRLGTPRSLPASFPKTLPLPAGTAITRIAGSHQKGLPPVITVQGFAPLSLSDAAMFFMRKLPERGFMMLKAESEPGLEAEGRFLGNGTSGAWKVRTARCSSGVALLVGVVLPS
jgi:hypothetical protein